MSRFGDVAARMPDPFRILWRDSVSSTNDVLRELAMQGMGEGLVLVADHQTAGRGRRGAEWFSPKGEGLAFSILLRPEVAKAFWSRLALTAGLAVAEAVEELVPLAEIKWPNDVLVGGKKLAGILVEAGADFVIIGIGINVNTEEFPEELNATSLRIESGREVALEEILLAVVKRIATMAPRIVNDFEEILAGVRERCALTGKQVTYLSGGIQQAGLVKGIGPGGGLLIDWEGKTVSVLQADEVRVVP